MRTPSLYILLSVALGELAFEANAQGWVQTGAPATNWVAVASSADGQRLVAAAIVSDGGTQGAIYISTNSAATWTQSSAPDLRWQAVASSADGITLLAAPGPYYGGPVFISTNSGTTWADAGVPPNYTWTTVACSADGRTLIAGGAQISGEAYGSYIYSSTNAGASWTGTNLLEYLNSVACSSDGTKVVSVFNAVTGAGILLSTNSGGTWAETSAPIRPWYSVASSADGTRLAAASGRIYLSSDSGSTWEEATNSNPIGGSIPCSSDGKTLVTVLWENLGNPIFTSRDFGVTWTTNESPVLGWTAAASSADGNRLVAVVSGGGIHTWQTTARPTLNVVPSGGNLVLSWTVPSMNFKLQQAAALRSGEWTAVQATPTLDYGNLQYEVSIPKPNGAMFFRLVSQ